MAVLPDAIQWFEGFIKTYTTKVQIGQGPAGVRPGMTAEVEIDTWSNDHRRWRAAPTPVMGGSPSPLNSADFHTIEHDWHFFSSPVCSCDAVAAAVGSV